MSSLIRRLTKLTLTRKLIIYLALTSVIPLLVLGRVSYDISRSAVHDEVHRYTREIMDEKKRYLGLLMQNVESLVLNLASLEDIKNILTQPIQPGGTAGGDYERLATQAKIGYILNEYANLRELISIDIFSLGNDHYHVGETLNVREIRKDIKQRIYNESLKSDQSVVLLGLRDNVNANSKYSRVISAVKIIRSLDPVTAEEKPVGFILVSYDTETFSSHFRPADGHANSQLFVIADQRGRIIHHPDKGMIGRTIDSEIQPRLTGEKGEFHCSISGEDMMVMYDRSIPGGWTLLSFYPMRIIEVKIATIKRNALLALAASLLLVIIFAFSISRRAVWPITRITDLFKQMQLGEPVLERLQPSSKDEIGELVKWFNTFLDSLEEKKKTEQELIESREQLRRSHNMLEKKVEERTTDLRQINVELRDEIAERKRAEQENAALQEQLRQSMKMEAIGRLAGGVAHDFNNLLTVIMGYGDLMRNRLEPDNPLRKDVDQILDAAERAASLTRQLLAFSRKQVLQPRVLDLNALVGNLEKMLPRLIGEDIGMETIYAHDLRPTRIDPGQMEQVILNLTVNARDAMPSGGTLTIKTANVELDQRYARTHLGSAPGSYVMLSVSDTGSGMTPEVRERIFEPFFTTKEQGKGTGLGLSMVYGIIKQSGGYIAVLSEPGRGAIFEIYLPAVDEPLDGDQAEDIHPKKPAAVETILLVEDETAVRNLASIALQGIGYKILEAANGGEALRLVQEVPHKPIHLLLTDVIMPGMNGRELADKVLHLCPGVKVLYMSGYTDHAVLNHGLLEPSVAFLQKPFTPSVLLSKVRQALDGVRDTT